MSIKLLDCTLRDGGYQNNWEFGSNNIQKMIKLLKDAGIDIIECGFLTQSALYDNETTRFNTVEQINDIIPFNCSSSMYVAMINYGEFNPDDLPECRGMLSGFRIAFHKKDKCDAFNLCKAIKDKGYKIFVQAMVSLFYSDAEFLNLIKDVNELDPFAFYIVDSFGTMKKRELFRLFYIAENNLSESIQIGFHCHNNMQLAYSNALMLTEIQSKHGIIIDASVYGMGRGAGNLNLELFAEHLNEEFRGNYKINPLLTIIDDVLDGFYKRNYWGYSMSNYISAKYDVHPDYASFLDNRNALTFEEFDEIIAMIPENKKGRFDRKYIEELYTRYMSRNQNNETNISGLKAQISGKTVLIICPGKSAETEREHITQFARNTITFAVNFDYDGADYIFTSNIKRYKHLEANLKFKIIATTNIPADGVFARPKYPELLVEEESVKDNAGLMLVKFVTSLGASKIYLAGMDGYSRDQDENFGESAMAIIMRNAVMDAMNAGMSEILTQYSNQIPIEFITEEKYVHINNNV